MYLEYWIENIKVDKYLIMFLYFASNRVICFLLGCFFIMGVLGGISSV